MCDTDMDGDGAHNDEDNCPLEPNPDQVDTDGDGYGDKCDNCPRDKNPEQTDENQNFIGDICEQGVDDDGDGFVGKPATFYHLSPHDLFLGSGDNCPHIPNYDQQDIDNDGEGPDGLKHKTDLAIVLQALEISVMKTLTETALRILRTTVPWFPTRIRRKVRPPPK